MKILMVLTALAITFTIAPGSMMAQQSKKVVVQNGQVIRIRCADKPDDKRWLSGTEEGVLLVKKPDASGTLWQVLFENNVVYLKNVSNPREIRWFHGETHKGAVNMVTTPKEHSGSRWEFTQLKDGTFEIRCLGHIDGFRWLHVDIAKGEASLRKKSDTPNITKWVVEVVKERK